jgi:hypothetical protein
MSDRSWLADVEDGDLGVLHYSLRMLLAQPGTSPSDAEQTEALADAAWDEITRRALGQHEAL